MKPEDVLPPDDADSALTSLLAALQQTRSRAALPAPELLARWLDGRATPEEAAAVERALGDDPDLRRAWLGYLAVAGDPAGQPAADPMPAEELRRLEALVPVPSAEATVHMFPRRHMLEWVACAAAVALAAWPAWKFGEHVARDRERAEQRELARLLGGNPLGGGAR